MSAELQQNLDRLIPVTEGQYNALFNLSTDVSSPAQTAASAVTPEQRAAINEMAVRSGESFDTCLRLWILASNHSTRREIERQLDLHLGTLDSSMGMAALAILEIEKMSILRTLTTLMRSRNDTVNSPEKQYIMGLTNRLIRDGIIGKCLSSIEANISELQSSQRAISMEFASKRSLLEKSLRVLSEAVFFIMYSTQIMPTELAALLSTIRSVSNLLADTVLGQISEWRASLYPVLVLLQLAHVGALNQTSILQSRSVDGSPWYSPSDREPGNDLPQISGGRDHMDDNWTSGLAKGFACLAHAVLRQPYVETGECPRADVIWFLQQASSLRGYSYVRLCLLPVLQTSFYDDQELLSFMISLLYELFENLAHIFSMPMYQLHEKGRTLELFPFFPLSQAQYLKDQTYILQSQESSGTHNLQGEEFKPVDCLDDVMMLFGLLCKTRPAFANVFWAGSTSFHPFVCRSVEFILVDPSLICATTRMLAGMSYGDENNAGAVFTFLRNQLPGRFDWRLIFNCLSQYSQQLGSKAMPHGGGRFETDVRSKTLSPRDTDGLLGILDLLAAVCTNEVVSRTLIESELTPISHLFSLLSCPVDPILKGAILHSLAAMVRSCRSCAPEVWRQTETYKLIPSKFLAGSEDRESGLRLELEAVEAPSGSYPITDGLLSLLLALFEVGPPADLGEGYRFPGVLPYLDHVLNSVLLKASMRLYLPEGDEGEAQRMRISAKAVRVLVSLLQTYPINQLKLGAGLEDRIIVELERDFIDEVCVTQIDGVTPHRTYPRPKSAGFSLMAILLDRSRSRLVEYLLQLLKEVELKSLEVSRRGEASQVAATAVDLVSRSKIGVKVQESELTALGFEHTDIDGAHWREVLVTQIVCLFYECSVREETFLSRIQGRQLSSFNPEALRMECVPLQLQPLSRVFSWSQRHAPLALIAATMGVRVRSTSSNPDLATMAISILEHVARVYPVDDNTLTTIEGLRGFLTSCVNIIAFDPPRTEAPPLCPRGYDIPATAVVFSRSTCQPVTDNFSGDRISLRSAVLGFLLAALRPGRLNVSHYLLRLEEVVIAAGTTANTDITTASRLLASPTPRAPVSALDAVLDLLLLIDPSIGSDLEDASKALELIYRLAIDPVTALPVIGLLRKRSLNFCLRMVGICTRSLRQLCGQLSGLRVVPLLNSLAWLLKLCTLELHTTKNTMYLNSNRALLELLLPSLAQDGDRNSLLETFLDALVEMSPSPPAGDPRHLGSLDSLKSITITYSLSASINKGVANACGDVLNEPPVLCTRIDTASMSSNPLSNPHLVHWAEEMNVYTAVTSAVAHVCQAWRQLLDVFAINEVAAVTRTGAEAEELYRVFMTVNSLLLEALIVSGRDACVLEQQARSLSRCLIVFRPLLHTTGTVMSSEDYEGLLHSVIRVLLSRACDSPGVLLHMTVALVNVLQLQDRDTEAHAIVTQDLLEPYLFEIVRLICSAASLQQEYRLLAFTALFHLISAVIPSDLVASGGGSSGVQYAVAHMVTLVREVLFVSAAWEPVESEEMRLLQHAGLSLLIQMTRVAGSTGILLEDGRLFDLMCGIRCFEYMYVDKQLHDVRERERLLLLTLRLLLAVGSCGRSRVVSDGLRRFLLTHRATLVAVLRLRDSTTTALETCALLTALLRTLAALAADRAEPLLGEHSDDILAEVCALVAYLGEGSGVVWSGMLNNQDRDAGREVLANCVAVLRITVAGLEDSGGGRMTAPTIGSVLGIDFIALADVFIRCNDILKRIWNNDNTDTIVSSSDWLSSTRLFASATETSQNLESYHENDEAYFIIVSENVLCLLLDLLSRSQQADLSAWRGAALRVAELAIGERRYPLHSLVKVTASKLADIANYDNIISTGKR